MPGESQVTPVAAPDPSVIATQNLDKEIKHVRELLETEIRAEKGLCDEKFRSIDEQLDLIERQRVEQKNDASLTRLETKADTTKALEAALVAAKDQGAAQAESFAREFTKSEISTARQIEQQGVTFGTQIAALIDKQNDLNDRVRTIESVKVGGQQTYASLYLLAGLLVALAGVAIALAQ